MCCYLNKGYNSNFLPLHIFLSILVSDLNLHICYFLYTFVATKVVLFAHTSK